MSQEEITQEEISPEVIIQEEPPQDDHPPVEPVPPEPVPLTNDQITELARVALRAMLTEHGSEYRFPADEIWLNIPEGAVVPSGARPHQPARLIKGGLIKDTGAMTRARSASRAGSPTREYRFGPALVQPSAVVASGQLNAGVSLSRIQTIMDAEGYVISTVELANFFLALMVSPLVILSGISGTGKSLLPRKFAKRTNSSFYPIPVQPQWSDNSDLFGYVPTITPDKYIKGALIDGLIDAEEHPEKLVIALLDEMNLAPIEHYFSDFLSVAETRSRDGDGKIASDPLPIDLPPISTPGTDLYASLRGIQMPPNLRVVGTANMDETTHMFSPKVLDRAFTIEFDDPDLTYFSSGSGAAAEQETFGDLSNIVIAQTNAISVLEAGPKSQELFDHIAQLLSEIQDILSPAGIKFGYRTRDAILLYLHYWKELKLTDIMTGYAALDFCLLQKVLPKIAGSGDGLVEALNKLAAWLNARSEIKGGVGIETDFVGPLQRSYLKVSRMIEILNLDGSTRYWGT